MKRRRKFLVCDTHADTLMRMIDLNYALDDERLQVSLPKMMENGHDVQIFACFIDPVVGKERFIKRTLQMIDLLKSEVKKHKKSIALCLTSRDIQKTLAQKKKVALLGIEGGHVIDNDLSVLRCFRELGVIYMTLTWSNTNDWADSSGDKERWGGLTPFGHEVVREMNRLKMLVDVSHVSDKAFWHALRTSSHPVIASHSSVRAICNHPRNMTDDMIRAMAERGGVIFINFYSSFIDQKFNDAYKRLENRVQKKAEAKVARLQYRPEMYTYIGEEMLHKSWKRLPKVTIEDVVKHIKHVVNIAGVESVGFGSDFDGVPFWPEGLADCRAFSDLCFLLQKRGFQPSQVEKIAGGNFRRVFKDVVG